MQFRIPPQTTSAIRYLYTSSRQSKKAPSPLVKDILTTIQKQDKSPISPARFYVLPAEKIYDALHLPIKKLHEEAKEWAEKLHLKKLFETESPVYNIAIPLLRVFGQVDLHYAEVIEQSKQSYSRIANQLTVQNQLHLSWKTLQSPLFSSLLALIKDTTALITDVDALRHGKPKNNEFICQFRVQDQPTQLEIHRDIGHEWIMRLPLSRPSFSCRLNIHPTYKSPASPSIPFSDAVLMNGETYHSVTMKPLSWLQSIATEPAPRIALFISMLKAPVKKA